jgi:hypothetical protein
MEAEWTVLLLIFINGGSNSNHDVGSPFCCLGHLLSLVALMVHFIRLIDYFLSLDELSSYGFISCWLFAFLASETLKSCSSVIAMIGSGSRDWLSPRISASPTAGVREKPYCNFFHLKLSWWRSFLHQLFANITNSCLILVPLCM